MYIKVYFQFTKNVSVNKLYKTADFNLCKKSIWMNIVKKVFNSCKRKCFILFAF